MRRTDLSRAVAAVAVAAAVFTAAPAWSYFSDATASASMSVGTTSLAPPTGVTATASCVGTLLKTPRVTVRWTASASPYATGYAITRLTAGSYVQIATVAAGATSYVDATVTTGTSYSYQVRTTYRSWYAASATASSTTAVLCL